MYNTIKNSIFIVTLTRCVFRRNRQFFHIKRGPSAHLGRLASHKMIYMYVMESAEVFRRRLIILVVRRQSVESSMVNYIITPFNIVNTIYNYMYLKLHCRFVIERWRINLNLIPCINYRRKYFTVNIKY